MREFSVRERCKKVRYYDKGEADQAISNMSELRSYKCPICLFWHLTSS